MKSIFALACVMFAAIGMSGQVTDRFPDDNTPKPYQKTEKEADDVIYSHVGIDKLPEFPGGIRSFYKFVDLKFRKPSADFKERIVVSMVVEKDGSLSNLKVIGKMPPELSNEMIRTLKMSPNWVPAQQNGKVVRCAYTFPIVFPLELSDRNATSIPDKN
ncbi:energy transducer TonB [Flavobacterium selenitireducens]|uniref:energy transducer TonB n=1 Tax=Flavobacterium selenitireducens TaxID=2722704 RepID=UPI00168B7976|nr:energy transducer TonB [Flavobacterium selenitireducens]MBD3582495.1 hypothetical protein [Flavobacterium selenitireducens]